MSGRLSRCGSIVFGSIGVISDGQVRHGLLMELSGHARGRIGLMSIRAMNSLKAWRDAAA